MDCETSHEIALQLQWGHGDEAVEELTRLSRVNARSMLQWGHGDEAVEEETRVSFPVDTYVASMGPRR